MSKLYSDEVFEDLFDDVAERFLQFDVIGFFLGITGHPGVDELIEYWCNKAKEKNDKENKN